MESLFAPPQEEWQRVSARLRTLRRVVLVTLLIVFAGAGVAVFGVMLGHWWIALLAVVVALIGFAWGWWIIDRNWRSWGYAERGDDLLVTHGVMFKSLVVVPYGRMQYVDVAAGPLAQRFGIATVQLHTATPATDAVIPGLTPPQAELLRDRLAAIGEARAAGL